MRRRQHVNPLGLSFESIRDAAPMLHSDGVEIEVGCADAQFLFERARKHPDKQFIGIEIRESLVRAVNEKASATALPVTAVFANANHHLASLLPEGRVQRAFVNFPDPWFKARHHKRRMINQKLAQGLAHVLADDGELWVQTDVWSVALDALFELEKNEELFQNQAGTWGFWHDGNPFGARSWREQDCEERGEKVWRLHYHRIPR